MNPVPLNAVADVPRTQELSAWRSTRPRRTTRGRKTARFRPRPNVAGRPVVVAVVSVMGLVATTVVQPLWPATLLQMALWFGGAWRPLAVPVALVCLAVAAVSNGLQPGAAWQSVRVQVARAGAWAPAAAAALLGLAAVAASAGVLSAAVTFHALVLFLLQAALFPGTPVVLAAAVALIGTLAVDARRQRVWSYALVAGRRWPRAAKLVLVALWPLAATAAASAILAAAINPAAMQGWGHADGADAQRYSFFASFYYYSGNDDRVVQRDGYELGKLGLVLPPGRSGSIVYRLERPPESVVLLKANFYNRRFDDPAAMDETFPNAIELSADQGHTYQTVLADTSVGEVVGNPVEDLTAFVGTSRTYWLRFRATNTTSEEVTVLPSFTVSTVIDPQALPDPSFPVVPYAVVAAVTVYAVARAASMRPAGAMSAGIVAGGILAVTTGGVVLVSQGPGRAAPELSGVATAAATALLDPSGGPSVRAALLAARIGAAAAGLSGIAWLWWWCGPAGVRRLPWLSLACLFIGLVALDIRWAALMHVRYEFLVPDAQGYQAIANEFPQKLAHYRSLRSSALLDELYAAGFDGRANVPAVFFAGGNNGREPLWPAAIRLVANVIGISPFHTRLTSLGFSVLVAIGTCWLAS